MSAATVTPGTTVTSTTPLTAAILNQLGNPQVEIPAGSITGAEIDADSVAAAIGDGASGLNYFLNPNFVSSKWTRGTTPVSCPAATQTYRADDWWCNPAGAAVTYEQSLSGPDTLSLHSALLTGAASVTTVDFGQDLLGQIAKGLAAPIVVSCYVYNGTGASLAPLLRIDTPSALDTFTTVTNRYSTAASPAGATSAWTRHTWTLDATAFTNIANGARVYLRFPSGSLAAGGQTVRVSQMKVERGTARSAFAMPLPETTTAASSTSSSTAAVENFLDNPDFAGPRWRESNTSFPMTSDAYTYNAEGWWAYEDGASSEGIYIRSTTVPSTLSKYSAHLRGGSAVGTVRFGQDRESHVAAQCQRNMAFAIYFYNGTGASLTPTLKVDTCDAENNFLAVTNRVSQTLTACPDGAWTRLTHSFDGALLTNLTNGFRIYVEVAAGILNTTGDVVRFAQAQLEPGTSASTYAPELVEDQRPVVTGQACGLRLATTSNSAFTLAAAELILSDPAGRTRTARNVSTTVAITTAGANGLDTGAEASNTWYAIWAVSNGTTTVGLLSTSFTAPTLTHATLAGYAYKSLVGVVRNDGTSDLVSFIQRDRLVMTEAVTAYNSTIATGATDVDLSAYIPPTAQRIHGYIGSNSTTIDLQIIINQTQSVGASARLTLYGQVGTAWAGSLNHGIEVPFSLPINSTTLNWQSGSATPTYTVVITSYDLDA